MWLMKTSTNKINLLRFLVPLLFIFFSNTTTLYSQASDGMDLRDCAYNCTSNNFTITDVFLSDTGVLPGNPIQNTTCTPGVEQEVWIIMEITSNQNGDVYHSRLFADLRVNGNPLLVINQNLGTLNGSNNGASTKVVYGPFDWTCGDLLTLENTLVTWRTSPQNPPNPLTYDCSDYNKAQCQFPSDAIVSTPLAVQYDYTVCTDNATLISTVTFESTTNGGSGVYVSYVWDYDGGTFIGGTASSPIVEYDITGAPYYPTLKVTDDAGNTNTFVYPTPLVPLFFPTELINTPSSVDLTCSANDGSGSFTASFGTPPYTFNVDSDTTGSSQSINMASTVLSFSGAGVGTIQVTITDAANCTATESITIVVGDTTDPTWTNAPSNMTVECDGTPDPSGAFAAWLVSFTATDDSGSATVTNDSIGLSDLCGATGTETVTFTATDACGNFITADASFTIEDTTSPSLTLQADVTIECTDDE